MISAFGNVLVQPTGISLSQDVGKGDWILGYDRRRKIIYGEVTARIERDPQECFLVTSLTGEAILTADNAVMTFGRPQSVRSLRESIYKSPPVKVERVDLEPVAVRANCSGACCVARFFNVLEQCIGSRWLYVSSLEPVARKTLSDCVVHHLAEGGAFISARRKEWNRSALSHDGNCRAFEVMDALEGEGNTSLALSPLRQLRLLHGRLNGKVWTVSAAPKFSPLVVSVEKRLFGGIDRLRTISNLGNISTVELRFEPQFSPFVSLLPFS